ncbi:MFS transporter, partial [Jatrophihabitans endophyticus]|uniref:MFS transporter n=1 Tax=Jatrophihabitans endophyticus TaxID=1206085 RepID=UPI0026ED9A24
MTATAPAAASRPSPTPARKLRRTELGHYPSGGQRFLCLGIVVLATIVLYYQFYLAGAVAAGTNGTNGILVDTKMSFVYYVNIAVVGYILGALASFVSGAADRYGRVNIVTGGLLVVGLLCLVGIPLTDTSKIGFALVFGAIGLVEGIILVATPALIRDFSPQLGRASAMGFWTLGPVIGSLVVSIQVSSTSNTYPWANQYVIAGIVGLVVAVLSLFFLRELSPELRDQVMVSARDRALVEARAAGIDVEASLKQPFRQMLKPDIVLSAFSISVFLIIYYVAVGFFPVFFQTVFGFSQSKANGIGNYIWAFDAGALLLIGYLSDKVRVRKPFMVVGAIGAIVMTVIFATRATHPSTSSTAFIIILSLLAVFLGVAYAPWMASFTETVEKRNPALTATGLAVWGLVIRIVIAISVFIVPHVVNTVSTLVEQGPVAQEIAAKYPADIATAQQIDPQTSAALSANPKDPTAIVTAISEISKAPKSAVALIVQNAGPLSAAQALTPATQAALQQTPPPTAAISQAVSEITAKLKVSPTVAESDLTKLAALTPAQLKTAQQYGAAVTKAGAQLTSLGKHITPADAKILNNAQSAAAASPKQWQHYFWIAV